MQHLRGLKIKEAATTFDADLLPDKKEKVVAAMAEGAGLGLYQYTPYKTVKQDDLKNFLQLEIVARPADYSWIQDVVQKTNIITDAVCFARDLVSAPANEMTPGILAAHAQKLAKKKCRLPRAGEGQDESAGHERASGGCRGQPSAAEADHP